MRYGLMIISVLLLTALLVADKRKLSDIHLLAKTLLSAVFVLVALTTPHLNLAYSWTIVIALAFCLAGDICLVFDSRKAFMAGLVVFLMGHLVYIFAFGNVAKLNHGTYAALAVAVIVSGLVYRWLKPHLGSMKLPVLAYVVVITAMVTAAGSVAGDARFSILGRWLVGAGAIMFYLSDLFVARQRFITQRFSNRYIGLPLYYGGQFLLAFSVGQIG